MEDENIAIWTDLFIIRFILPNYIITLDITRQILISPNDHTSRSIFVKYACLGDTSGNPTHAPI